MQYIDLENLKPALEGVEGLGVDVLESILGLAETNEFVDRTSEIEELNTQIEELNTTHTAELITSKYPPHLRYSSFALDISILFDICSILEP